MNGVKPQEKHEEMIKKFRNKTQIILPSNYLYITKLTLKRNNKF